MWRGLLDNLLMTFGFGALNTLVYAMLLFLLSAGLTVVFGMLGIMNVAHGSFFMIGAYLAYTWTNSIGNFWTALLVVPCAVGFLGMLVERFALRRVHNQGHSQELLLTLGLTYVVLELVKVIWGTSPLPYDAPSSLDGSVLLLKLQFPTYRLFIVVFGLVVLGALGYLAFRTRIGMIIRAAVSDVEMVGALGFNVKHLFISVFGGGAFLAGLAGVVAGPLLSVYPGMANDMLVDTFVVVVTGGLGSIVGALIASVLVAALQSFGVLLMPQFAMLFSFALMIVILIWRPMGLFGERA